MSLVTPSGQGLREQLDLIKRTVAKGCTDLELELFIKQCERTGLDPFARQIYAVKRYDSQARQEVMQTQVSIDGLRSLADETGLVAGQVGPYWCGPKGEWLDVWLSDDPPKASKVIILRTNPSALDKPSCFTGIALWDSYCQTTKEGRPTKMWAQMGPEMLAKCAEALGLRKAFPMKLSGLYSGDEMGQASNQPRDPDLKHPLQSTLNRPEPVSPVLPPPRTPERPPTGEIEASEGTLGPPMERANRPAPLEGMRRAVSQAFGQLSIEQRSAVLAKGDAEKLHLPEEQSFTSDQANRWMVIIREVKQGD